MTKHAIRTNDPVILQESKRLGDSYREALDLADEVKAVWGDFDKNGFSGTAAEFERFANMGTPAEAMTRAFERLDEWRTFRAASGLL